MRDSLAQSDQGDSHSGKRAGAAVGGRAYPLAGPGHIMLRSPISPVILLY